MYDISARIRTVNWYWTTLVIIFSLFFLANAAYLHRVPGLMGDEASEGENVYMLLNAGPITITGERSYIGPFIDYLRVPFIFWLGYNALALRVLILLFSLGTFPLAIIVCRRLWGKEIGLVAAVAMLFSPIYLTYQRLGWAITLFPFFALLTLYLLTLPQTARLKRYGPLLAGLASGIGLHNHAIFLPTLAGVFAGWGVALLLRGRWRDLAQAWPAAVGFWAGFGTQFAVMFLSRGEFADAAAATGQIGERITDFPQLLPLIISGSSYIAQYTGDELAPLTIRWITWVALGLAGAALVVPRKRGVSWAWVLGLAILWWALLYMAFQFSLRYFVTFGLGIWALAGAGGAALLERAVGKRWAKWPSVTAVVLALVLTSWAGASILAPFLRTGGSTEEFSLGNRSGSAAALADTASLTECLKGAGPVYSESVHIQNRLRYLSYDPNNNFEVIGEKESKKRAVWIVSYRLAGDAPADREFEKCPELSSWRVLARDRG